MLLFINVKSQKKGSKLHNLINKKVAFENSPQTNQKWISLSEQDRIDQILKSLKQKPEYENFEIMKAENNGNVILRTEKLIKANERGVLLLEIEQLLKDEIDSGITVWLEPVGDKSKLRNLRGIEIKSD